MRLNEFINIELKDLASAELKKNYSGDALSELLEQAEKVKLNDDYELDEQSVEILKNPDLYNIEAYNLCLKIIMDDGEVQDSYAIIEEKLQYNPKNRLYGLIKIVLKMELIERQECFDKDIALFFDDLFKNYSYLVELDDFFKTSSILNIYDYNISSNKDLFIPVLNNAIKIYPKKLKIHQLLALLYYMNEDYDNSLSLYLRIVDYVEKEFKTSGRVESDSFYWTDYLDVLTQLAMIYDIIGKYDQALKCVDFVIENIPVVYVGDSNDEIEDIQGYIDCFLIRMRVNVINNNIDAIVNDYNRIKEHLFGDWWKQGYNDVFEFIEKMDC